MDESVEKLSARASIGRAYRSIDRARPKGTKSPSNKSGIGFVESISVSAPHSTHFVPSFFSEPSVSEVVSETVKPLVSEVVKPIEVSVRF